MDYIGLLISNFILRRRSIDKSFEKAGTAEERAFFFRSLL